MSEVELIHGDRRTERRYEFAMNLRYSYRHGSMTYRGTGRTIDLSRCAIRFEADGPLPAGVRMELEIAWPFLLQGICPLVLVVTGQVMQTDQRGTVLRMSSHEFRTAGQRSFTAAAAAPTVHSIFA